MCFWKWHTNLFITVYDKITGNPESFAKEMGYLNKKGSLFINLCVNIRCWFFFIAILIAYEWYKKKSCVITVDQDVHARKFKANSNQTAENSEIVTVV